ncbi:penicillin-binding protein 1F [Variibacter gotjawalensis]|uniref:Biosynthetic peptidoglycan transglycosylase n=1 Tax=Variibacter gotjawalensis TaxID=1333996 RepID=A0A0S3PRY3_9BRAD|nr:monofunctional biosynthetic peptidoglycan transglycosylase [Variibacter gotjawalensis]NIK48946.1 monofunctional biosynthetic peptidoglycan transglycosylase [Variibacter gotjawalensis]RZS50802.1 monofunctional biosynthetic peptidoglycan transglycosylase [Variibacter gotjawalensis]BAT58636.1 penicillin-binding protein 1F [Variibacter gotjawalensis]
MRFSSGTSRVLRWAIGVILFVLLLPYVLTLAYAVVTPVSTPMLWRYLTLQRVTRTYVPMSEISSALPQSVIAAEDANFCKHNGIDWSGLRAAIDDADSLNEARGGSTVTQQLAKNLFLWNGRSFVRKGLEFPLALWIDLVLSKRRIMELYLNVAEWGPNGEFGADAGARYAFGKSPRDISGREAALMAAILPNPVRRSARKPGGGVQRLAGLYQGRARNAEARCLSVKSR